MLRSTNIYGIIKACMAIEPTYAHILFVLKFLVLKNFILDFRKLSIILNCSLICYIYNEVWLLLNIQYSWNNATSFLFWLRVAEIATLLLSVSITNLWSSSIDINVTCPLSYFGVWVAFLAMAKRGNSSASVNCLIFNEESALL